MSVRFIRIIMMFFIVRWRRLRVLMKLMNVVIVFYFIFIKGFLVFMVLFFLIRIFFMILFFGVGILFFIFIVLRMRSFCLVLICLFFFMRIFRILFGIGVVMIFLLVMVIGDGVVGVGWELELKREYLEWKLFGM